MKDKICSLSHYVEYLQSRGKYWLVRKEVMASLRLTANAFKKAAHRLRVKGKLMHVRSDFYMLVPPEYRMSGALPASWFIDDLMRYLNQDYYCGLLTAAALQGAAHQQPMVFQVVTNKRTRPISLGQVRIEFVFKKNIRSCFFQRVKTATGTMKVSIPEMTAFDLVRYLDTAGQINPVATVLCELVEQLEPKKLAELLESGEVEVTNAQRLGYLLDKLELIIDLKPLEAVLKCKQPARRLLVTGVSQPIIEYNQRWHILANEKIEPDTL